MTNRLFGLLLVINISIPAVATAESQSFEIAMRMLCDASNHIAASTEGRSEKLKTWIKSIIQNDEAKTLLSELSTATPDKREALIRSAKAKVGLKACPVWDSLALQIMFSSVPAKEFHHQTFYLAMWMFCDAGGRFPAGTPQRLVSLESWIKELLENPKALGLFNTLLNQSKEAALRQAGKAVADAGLAKCKIVESGDLAALVNVHEQRRNAAARRRAQQEAERKAKAAALRALQQKLAAFKTSITNAPKVTIKLVGADISRLKTDGSQWDEGTFDKAEGERRARKMEAEQKRILKETKVQLARENEKRKACINQVRRRYPRQEWRVEQTCGTSTLGNLGSVALGLGSLYSAINIKEAYEQAGAAHVDVTGSIKVEIEALGYLWKTYTQERKLTPIANTNQPRWHNSALYGVPLIEGLKMTVSLYDYDGRRDREDIRMVNFPHDWIKNALQQYPRSLRIPFETETDGVVEAVYITVKRAE